MGVKGFPKGTSGNPKGRPRGAKTKIKGDILAQVKEFIENNMEDIQEDYDLLEPKEKMQFLIKLLEFAIPKATAPKEEEAEEYKYPNGMNLLQYCSARLEE